MTFKVPENITTTNLPKPKGQQLTYVFTSGQRLHVFGVKEQNLSGAWYRVTDHTETLHIIDPAKVDYIVSKWVD